MHEISLHDQNCYVTLTYGESLSNRSLVYKDFRLFLRRARRELGPLRFYVGGEYGSDFARPHFHSILFGVDFPDREHWCQSPAGFDLDRSAVLERLWPHGFSSVGDATFESAAYVARYLMKKVNGDEALDHYLDRESGELRVPEFNRMSLRPGIGADWLRLYWKEVILKGTVVVRGVEAGAPRYYLKKIQELEAWSSISKQRRAEMLASLKDNTRQRLDAKEAVCEAKVGLLKRSIT